MTQIQGGDTLTQLDGKGIQLTVDKLVVIRHGPGDIVRVNENNIQPLMIRLSLFKVNPKSSVFHYSEFAVQDQSAFFIKKLWTLNNSINPNPVLQKSILPNGCFNIAIINGPGIFVRYQNADIRLTKGVYYCGQITKAIQVDVMPSTKATMIQLFPWTPVHFLFTSVLSALTDSIAPIHELSSNLPIQWDYLLGLHNESQIHRYVLVKDTI